MRVIIMTLLAVVSLAAVGCESTPCTSATECRGLLSELEVESDLKYQDLEYDLDLTKVRCSIGVYKPSECHDRIQQIEGQMLALLADDRIHGRIEDCIHYYRSNPDKEGSRCPHFE